MSYSSSDYSSYGTASFDTGSSSYPKNLKKGTSSDKNKDITQNDYHGDHGESGLGNNGASNKSTMGFNDFREDHPFIFWGLVEVDRTLVSK